MFLKLLAVNCLFVSTFAWLAPERCSQSKQRRSASLGDVKNVRLVSNIKEVAEKQQDDLLETYANHRFFGVPIRVRALKTTHPNPDDPNSFDPEEIVFHAPYNCTFHTYDPRRLASVTCIDAACKLSHTVSTVDTYTASEGYNWGVKISSKFSLFDKLFEIGGEASTGGTYSCTYNKGKITTDLVECSVSTADGGHLQLYTVKSDMYCGFGDVKLARDSRDHGNWEYNFYGPASGFTSAEVQGLKASAEVFVEPGSDSWFILDTDKVPNRVLQRLLNEVPLFDPHTDLMMIEPGDVVRVIYFKQVAAVEQYRSIVPFTNEAGDAVYQYACVKV